MKKELLAKVTYNDAEDAFELWLYDNDSREWGFSRSAKCQTLDGQEGEAEFIHFSFMTEILRCATLGYKILDKRF